jgi:hypothetical protein
MTKRIDPTPEDYDAVRRALENPREHMFEVLVRQEARRRVERERRKRRRKFIRRLFPFRGTA